jgi:hypothetical protein
VSFHWSTSLLWLFTRSSARARLIALVPEPTTVLRVISVPPVAPTRVMPCALGLFAVVILLPMIFPVELRR